MRVSFGDVHELPLQPLDEHVHDLRGNFPDLRILVARQQSVGKGTERWDKPSG